MSNRFSLAKASLESVSFQGSQMDHPEEGPVVSKPSVLTRLTKHQPVPKHLQGDGINMKIFASTDRRRLNFCVRGSFNVDVFSGHRHQLSRLFSRVGFSPWFLPTVSQVVEETL